MKRFFAAALGLIIMGSVQAEAKKSAEHIAAEATIRERLAAFPVQSVRPAPISGLYEVIVGGQITYFSADMGYLFDGDIVDYTTKVNLTEQKRNSMVADMFKELKPGDYLAFTPKSGAKHVINVFTDVDCGFCRKLHQEVPRLNEKGVEVRYFLFPRAGLDSRSARTLESVWCAADQQEAMNRAKAGKSVEAKSCDNPIENHLALGEQVGLRGTPLIITNGGGRISGYRPADQIYAQLLTEAVEEK